MRRVLLFLVGIVLSAAVVAAQNAPVTAIRAGRLLDPEAGRILTNQVILVDGNEDSRGRAERRDPGRRAGHRSVAHDRHAGPGGRAQSSRAHLQARSREQHLLLHLRAGIDGAARDSGGVERHADAERGLHHRPRHGQQRALCGHGAAPGDRAGLDSGTDDHQLRHHHRRHGRAVLSDAGDGEEPQHRLSGVSRRRHAGRNRQGDPPERALRRRR